MHHLNGSNPSTLWPDPLDVWLNASIGWQKSDKSLYIYVEWHKVTDVWLCDVQCLTY